jgi:glutamyl-Q tRNA(Asp) synthetase
LHFGSLVAAVGSYLDARHHGGDWLLRIEDIDPPREIPGAADDILRTLEALGLGWDGPVAYQSRRSRHYAAALRELERQGLIYACACTRREIADSTVRTGSGNVYPGTCRRGLPPGRSARSLRVRVDEAEIQVTDRLQETSRRRLETDTGDFVLRRADRLIAYQLAVVVDDAGQAVTHVVRGADLYDSTARQIHLQQLLDYPVPAYLHLPVAVDVRGEKLSKQTRARGISAADGNTALIDALRFLHQPLPDSPDAADRDELLAWAIEHWDIRRIPAKRRGPAPARYLENIPERDT